MAISLLNRRESIIISTVETLNEVGLQNLSTRLIAKKEGVSEGTIFRHFKNKNEIMIAVIDHFSQFDDSIMQTTINRHLSPVETIRHFIVSYVEYYENYPEITVIPQAYDSLMCDDGLSSKVQSIINNRSEFLIQTIERGRKDGTIKASTDSVLLQHLITGGMMDICLKWRVDQFSFSIKDRTSRMLDMVLDSIVET